MKENQHQVTYTTDIFGDETGYFYSVDVVEKPKWRVTKKTTRLGFGQTESFADALAACRRIVELNMAADPDAIDAAPPVGVE